MQKFLLSQNNKYHFADKFISRVGTPFWNKSLVYDNVMKTSKTNSGQNSEGPATVVYIPFVRDSQNYVNGSILVNMTSTDTAYRVICDWQYDEFGFTPSDTAWCARDIFNIFSKLDYSVFGQTTYWVKDGRIFGYPKQTQLKVTHHPEITSEKNSTESTILLCYTSSTVCVTAGEFVHNKITTSCGSTTTCSAYWISNNGGSPGPLPSDGGGGGSGGGSGGNGNGGPEVPPNPCPVQNRPFNLSNTLTNPCDTASWESILDLEADTEFTCPANFTFVAVTTSNLWQEAELTNIYCNLAYLVEGMPVVMRVRIPQLFFGMAYFNVDGNLIFSQNTAKETAADALNQAEIEMRRRFSRYPGLTSLQLQEYWVERTNYYMNFLTDNLNRGRATRQGSISPSNIVIPRPYIACY